MEEKSIAVVGMWESMNYNLQLMCAGVGLVLFGMFIAFAISAVKGRGK